MINYWSFTNNVNDSIGTAHLYHGVNASLTHDRFGNDNSSLRLNSGYYCVPPGVYFSGPFTTSVWVNAKSYNSWARVFDFGIGQASHNVVFYLFKDSTNLSLFVIYQSSNRIFLGCNRALVLNEWAHLAVTFDDIQSNFYYNGIFCNSTSLFHPANVTRNKNYIGKSNWAADELANAIYDELRIYNRVLDQTEILDLMNF